VRETWLLWQQDDDEIMFSQSEFRMPRVAVCTFTRYHRAFCITSHH
jgi:hypothetical protein